MIPEFSMSRSMSVLGFAALVLVAGSAHSQSAEYRRGYDQGYRDGSAAAVTQNPYPNGMGQITISSALYGIRGARCDARDSLQTLAFEILARQKNLAPARQVEMVRVLAVASGSCGMAGGQAIDLDSVGKPLTQPELELMHALKTGALIRAAADGRHAINPDDIIAAARAESRPKRQKIGFV